MKYIPILALIVILSFISGCVTQPQQPTHTSPSTVTSAIPTSTTSGSPRESPTPGPFKSNMAVSFIDVGQGDSELIQSPSGMTMLIDAGPNEAAPRLVNFLHDHGVSTLNVVVATHPHEDHIGGMAAVLNTFTVKQFIDSGYPHNTSTYENMLNLIDQKNIPFQTVKSGDTIALDPGISVQVLNPQGMFSSDINQNSMVLKMTYGKVSYLFSSDVGGEAENLYARSVGHIDIFKVPHHGSSTSSGSFLLTQLTPLVSVIEVGAGNPYGYPAPATLQRLQQSGLVYRTDLNGTITVTSDGNTYTVSTEK